MDGEKISHVGRLECAWPEDEEIISRYRVLRRVQRALTYSRTPVRCSAWDSHVHPRIFFDEMSPRGDIDV